MALAPTTTARPFTISYESRDGAHVEAILPTRWEICGCCDGEGTTSSAVECDGGGFTASEWAEQDHDSREDYLAGQYARACDECRGSGKGRVLDHDRLTDEQAEALHDQSEADDYIDAEMAAERRFGC